MLISAAAMLNLKLALYRTKDRPNSVKKKIEGGAHHKIREKKNFFCYLYLYFYFFVCFS